MTLADFCAQVSQQALHIDQELQIRQEERVLLAHVDHVLEGKIYVKLSL